MTRRQLLFQNHRAVGDAIVLSAAIRDFKLAYPDIDICVSTEYPQLWIGNPYITELKAPVERVGLAAIQYVYKSKNNIEKIHYIQVFHRVIKDMLGLKVPLTVPRPDLHLTEAEKTNRPIAEPYWVVVAGTKRHATTKQWHVHRYQETVDRLRQNGLSFVQLGVTEDPVSPVTHIHPKLTGVYDFVGKTTLRQMMQVIYHSDGVICPITAAMHMAAAFCKPCIVLAGGREEYSWAAYSADNPAFASEEQAHILPSHTFLSTVGQLDCCAKSGCWKSHVEPAGVAPFTPSNKTLCSLPVLSSPMTVPRCLDLISVDNVVDAVMSCVL